MKEELHDDLGMVEFELLAKCRKCGGKGYVTDGDRGAGSEETGEWAYFELTCEKCGNKEHVSTI